MLTCCIWWGNRLLAPLIRGVFIQQLFVETLLFLPFAGQPKTTLIRTQTRIPSTLIARIGGPLSHTPLPLPRPLVRVPHPLQAVLNCNVCGQRRKNTARTFFFLFEGPQFFSGGGGGKGRDPQHTSGEGESLLASPPSVPMLARNLSGPRTAFPQPPSDRQGMPWARSSPAACTSSARSAWRTT